MYKPRCMLVLTGLLLCCPHQVLGQPETAGLRPIRLKSREFTPEKEMPLSMMLKTAATTTGEKPGRMSRPARLGR